MGSMRVRALSWGKPDYLGVTILGDARLSDALCFIAVGVDTDGRGGEGVNWPARKKYVNFIQSYATGTGLLIA